MLTLYSCPLANSAIGNTAIPRPLNILITVVLSLPTKNNC